MNLTKSLNKLITVETEIANSVYKKVQNNNCVYIPPNIIHCMKLHFATDNTDFRKDDGKSEFHGLVFQKNFREKDQNNLHIEHSLNTKMKFQKDVLTGTKYRNKPVPVKNFPSLAEAPCSKDLDFYKKTDQIFALKFVKDINVQTSQNLKTIVTLDLKLYRKCK